MDQINSIQKPAGRDLLWPRAIIAFFIILAAADAVIIWLAFSNHPDRTTKNPYADALGYGNVVAQLSRAGEWGLQGELSASRLSNEAQQYELSLLLSGAVSGDTVTLSLSHSRFSGFDRTARLERSSESEPRFIGQVELPQSGLWNVEIEVARGDKERARIRSQVEAR